MLVGLSDSRGSSRSIPEELMYVHAQEKRTTHKQNCFKNSLKLYIYKGATTPLYIS